MKTLAILSLAASLALGSVNSNAEQAKAKPQAPETYQHQGKKYPPVMFYSNIDDVDIKQLLQNYQAFSELDESAIGAPIGIRVLNFRRNRQDGTQASSLMLSATTLGLIPIVSNQDFNVYYDVFIQGEPIARFKYTYNTTDVHNIWAADSKQKAEPEEVLFIKHTLPKFLNELKKSEEAQALFAEYWDYFDS
ncbi:MAG: hypothetical protein OIF35_08525 [Cellvibrionaceae bacterium]|nr:hypothetical protein [Cellvibrionaceae bacterium]MCV6626360.1 hypothetical protein [Cellvibrionaceae bacterium]